MCDFVIPAHGRLRWSIMNYRPDQATKSENVAKKQTKNKGNGSNNLHFDISLSCRPLGNMVEVNDVYVPLFG